ncbi:MAG: addiction module protein [Sedimenticola sp.]
MPLYESNFFRQPVGLTVMGMLWSCFRAVLSPALSTNSRFSTKMFIMNTAKTINIQELSQSERILLAEELWDSIANDENTLEVTESQKKILAARLSAYKASPDEGSSWEEVKNEMI